MKQKSLANPTAYKEKVNIYYEFSKAEDYLKKIEKFLLKETKNKIVLDIGCGNGRYAKFLAPSSKKYFALDISKEQLKLAKDRTKRLKNIKFILSDAEKIPLPNNSVDVIVASFAISVILEFKKKKRVLKEMIRVVREQGKIFLVENDSVGEFEEIRGHTKRTENYNRWLKKQGFKEKKIKTFFRFNNLEHARNIFKEIWGKSISDKIKGNKVEHRAIIFSKVKLPTEVELQSV